VKDNIFLLRVSKGTAGAGVVSNEEVELVESRAWVVFALRALGLVHAVDEGLCMHLPLVLVHFAELVPGLASGRMVSNMDFVRLVDGRKEKGTNLLVILFPFVQ
jgi:hypothetical protein